jgi:hypothetical protein
MRRTAYQVLAASAASFALAQLLPAEPLGGVRGMLVVLPVVAALFASVGRSAGRNRPSVVEVVVWGGWILLALQHQALGIPGASGIVAAVGLALAGARTLALAVRLRRRIEPPVLWPFFALPLALYLFAWPWTTTARFPDGDEPYYLLLTHSLAEDGDVDLADEYREEAWRSFTTVPVEPQPGDPMGPDGEIYSRHNALLPLSLAPLYRLAGPFGAQLGMLALAAAAAAAGLAAARARFPGAPRGALAAWAILAFAPPLVLYAGQFWVEVPAALLVALVFWSLAQLDRRESVAGTFTTRNAFLVLALALVALPLLKLRFLALALPLGVLAFARLRSSANRRRELALLAAATLLALGLWNTWRFGNPLRMYAGSDLAILGVPLGAQLRGGFGLFFDAAFGLFALAPIWLLLVPAVHLALRRLHRHAGQASFVRLAEVAAFVPYLLLIGMRREWYGGWSPPFRYGVVLLPALALLLAPLFATKRPTFGLRWLGATLSALSATVALVYLVHPAWVYSLANGSSRLLDELSRNFAGDLVRLFPSMVRVRPATWIVPIALSLAVLVIALAGGRVRRSALAHPRFLWHSAVLGLLLLWSTLLAAAQRLPTSRIEFEDSWVSHQRGALFPERWTVDRTRFDGGWALRHTGQVSARPVAGGRSCRLAIRLLPVVEPASPLALEVRAGERLVATLSLPTTEAGETGDARARTPDTLPWVTLEAGPFAIAGGEELAFRAVGPATAGAAGSAGSAGSDTARSFVVLDRADLFWQ